jgi:beta-galactosidase
MKTTSTNQLPKLFALLLLVSKLGGQTSEAKTDNDNLFPSGSSAANVIKFDGRGFILNGQRTFLTSGSVHYARLPREDWRDILLKLKRAGFNTVETYVFWSYHEAHEGRFDFTADSRDLGAFLDTAKEVGLYAIIRVGPYSCAEWENGGFPNWMYFKPGLEVRKDNPEFNKYLDRWFNRMLPIISTRQIQNGGNVILVQLENEYPAASWKYWGTEIYGNYFQHLLDLAHTNGIAVPMFFSGLNHGHDPAPETPIDSLKRSSPWMSTELWTIWFDKYGVDAESLSKGDRSTWRVLSEGGNGFNLYMAYGGTTFGFDNFNEDRKFGDNREKGVACYDYGTLIGQAGNLTELYYRMKRLGYFAETFSPILADGTNTTDSYQDFAGGAKITARTSPKGTLVFLDNAAPLDDMWKKKWHVKTSPGVATNIVLKTGAHLHLAEGEILGLALNVPIAPGVTLAEADTRILGIVPQGEVTTIVCYGEPGDAGKITFTAPDASELAFEFPTAGVVEKNLKFGATQIRVLAMSKATADKTWFADTAAGKRIVIGANYLGDFSMDTSGEISATVDYPWNESAPVDLTIYGSGGVQEFKLPEPKKSASPEQLSLADWQMSCDNVPLRKNYDDHNWFASSGGNPPVMGEDGDYTAFAWYRASLASDASITSLHFARIGDRATFFVDGKHAADFDLMKNKSPDIALNIPPGKHELAVFVAQFGRRKYAGYVGPIDLPEDLKGLIGPVTVNGTNVLLALNWKMRGGVDPQNSKLKWSAIKSAGGAPAYFKTEFQLDSPPESGLVYRLVTDGLSFGSVWLNAHNLGRYPELVKDCPGIWLPSCWMKQGENTLVIYDERGNSPQEVRVNLETGAGRHRAVLNSATGN